MLVKDRCQEVEQVKNRNQVVELNNDRRRWWNGLGPSDLILRSRRTRVHLQVQEDSSEEEFVDSHFSY